MTLRTLRSGLGAGYCGRPGSPGTRAECGALRFTRLTALGIVLELFIQKEDLLPSREDELAVAVYAGQKSVVEL